MASTSAPAPSLGEALRDVFAAESKALKRVCKRGGAKKRGDDELLAALKALVSHANDDLDGVLEPTLERLSGSKAVKYAFSYLASSALAEAVGAALELRLGEDATQKVRQKVRQLQACVAIGSMVEVGLVDVRVVFTDVKRVVKTLLGIARGAGEASPTRLGAAAADAAILLSNAFVPVDDETGDTSKLEFFDSVVDDIVDLLGLVLAWSRSGSGSGLFRDSCENAHRRVATLAKQSGSRAEDNHARVESPSVRTRTKLVCRAWRDWSPSFLTMTSLRSEKETLEVLRDAFDAADVMVRSDDAGEGVAHALITCGLIMGRFGVDHADKSVMSSVMSAEGAAALDEMMQKYTGSVLMPALRCNDAVAQGVAAILLRVVLAPEHLGWTDQSQALLDGVLPLVEEGEDAVSPGFARLVADLIVRDPSEEALVKIFQVCGGTARSAKISGLRVLADIAKQGKSNMSAQTLTLMIQTTLPRLSDKDLETRRAAADVVAHLDAAKTMPVLISLLDSKDAGEQSAAIEAIVSTMEFQRSSLEAVETYLRTLCTPSIWGSNDEAVLRERLTRAVKVLGRFAEKVREHEWVNVARLIVEMIFEAPSSSALHQAFVTLSPWMGKPPANRAILDACTRRLLKQSDDKGSDESDVFNRLGPLLVLRALPVEAWDENADAARDIEKCLRHRMLNISGEYEDVRRVSSELYGRMPKDFLNKDLISALESAYANGWKDSDDLSRLRSCMFSLNSALSVRGESVLTPASKDVLRSVSVNVLTWPASPDDAETKKAHMGAIETLASLVVSEIEAIVDEQKTPASRARATSSALLDPVAAPRLEADPAVLPKSGGPLIVELDGDESSSAVDTAEDSPCDTLRGVLHLACNHAQSVPRWVGDLRHNQDLPMRLAMMNVIIATARRPFKTTSSVLMDISFPPLVKCAERRGDAQFRGAALQALMMVFHASNVAAAEAHAVQLVQTTTNILRDHAAGDVARMGATKVATALLAADESVLKTIEPHLDALRSALEIAARVAVDPEVTALATKLATCMTIPN